MNISGDNQSPDPAPTFRREDRPWSGPARTGSGAPANAPAAVLPVISDHELVREIGRGSYGEVWLARNVLGDYRAVKVVYRRTFESARPFDREFEGIKKFEPISRSHESQVQILHVGRASDDSCFYYIMELADAAEPVSSDQSSVISDQSSVISDQSSVICDQSSVISDQSSASDARAPSGTALNTDKLITDYFPRTLRSEIERRGRLPFEECLEIALKLTQAVGHLHQHGLVHRDIKPSNIIFVNGIPKLADIGLVAKADATLSFVGTEGFLPPEGPGKPQADLYSLGKVLYEISTGRDRRDFPELPTDLRAVADRERLVEFNEIILKACDPQLDRRYETAEQMYEELLLLRAGKSLKRSRLLERRLALLTRLSAAGIAATALVAAAYFYQQYQTREATRLAQANKELAQAESRQRDRAEFQRIEQMLETGQSSQALAMLAHRLREHPNDELAARRLLSALTYRNFALPIAELDHDSRIQCADVSPDGRYVATGTGQGTFTLWNATNGIVKLRVQAGGFTWSVRFSPDGKRIVTASRDGQARVWDLTGEPRVLQELKHPSEVRYAEFSPEGKWIVTASVDGRARVWNAQTGEEYFSLLHDNPQVFIARFSPDGQKIVTSTLNVNNIHVWDFVSQRLESSLNDPRYLIGVVGVWNSPFQFDPIGPRIAYIGGGRPAHLRIWNYANGEITESKEAHDWMISSVDFSPDGRKVASVSNDQTLRIWNAQNGQPASPKLLQGGGLTCVAFSPNGQSIASASADFTIQLWDPISGARLGEPIQHPGSVRFLQFSPNGKKLISCTWNKAWIWDIRPGDARPNLLSHDSGEDARDLVAFVQFDRMGNRLLTALMEATGGGSWERRVDRLGVLPPYAQVWDARTGEPQTPRLDTLGTWGGPARFDKDGSLVIAAANDGSATVWNATDGSIYRQLRGMSGAAGHVDFSPDSRYAVVGEGNDRALIWDVVEQRVIHTLDCGDSVWYTEFSSDGKKLLTTTGDRQGGKGWGIVWDVSSGKRLTAIQSRRGVGFGIFSPDGQSVLLPDGDRCRIYDAQTGRPLTDWMKHDGAVLGARFSRDGKRLVTCSFDQTARVWDAGTGQLLIPDLHHQWLVPTADFSPKDNEVATGSWDRTARIWDLAFGSAPSEPFRHDDWVLALAYHPEGNWLATGCADGNARIWEVIQAPGSVPDWVVRLAEALAGYRMNRQQNLDRTTGYEDVVELREKLSASPEDNYYTRWARWFFGNREMRRVSPTAHVTMASYLARRAAEDSIFPGSSLDEALRYSPMDPQLLARLGRKLVVPPTRDSVINLERSDWFTRLALKMAPDMAMAWWARAEVLDASKRFAEADNAVRKALELDSKDPNAWHVQALILQHTDREEAAYQTYKQAVELARADSSLSSLSAEPYLNETLKSAMARRHRSYSRWHEWSEFPRRSGTATDRARLESNWESALALEQAAPDQQDHLWLARISILKAIGARQTVITRQPDSRRVAPGERVTFEVELADTEPLLIQWQHDGRAVIGATNRILILENVTPENAGEYTVLVRGPSPASQLAEQSKPVGLELMAGDLVYGCLRREIYRGIRGEKLSDLTNHLKFPDQPDEVDVVHAWEQPQFHEKMGVRLSGYLVPKVSGKYVFYLCSDEQGALFLSDNESPENKRQIAFEPVWHWSRTWTGTERRGAKQNISPEIALEAGKRYYVESVVLNSSVTGNLGVAWQLPGQPPPPNGSPPIPGQYLAVRAATIPHLTGPPGASAARSRK